MDTAKTSPSPSAPGPKVVDGHVHLDRLDDWEACLAEARAKGVEAVVAVGMDELGNRFNLDQAQVHKGFVYAAVGLHPWMVKEATLTREVRFVNRHLPRAVALGEVGLDFKFKKTRHLQEKALRMMLEEAALLDKPVIVHSRYSHAHTLRFLRDAGIRSAVFHWYSGPLDVLADVLRHGYFISATPALSYSKMHQEAIRQAPLEQILLETDAPVAFQGEPARPVDVLRTLEGVALLKSLDRELVAEITTQNAANLYGMRRDQA